MLIVFVVSELFEDILCPLVCDLGEFDPFFLDLLFDTLQDLIWNLCGFLRLKLCKNLSEMIDQLIIIKSNFLRRFFVGWLLILHQKSHTSRTMITYQYPLVFDRYHLASVTRFAYVGLHNEVTNVQK